VAIRQLNPDIANKLPAANITLGYSDNAVISVPEVFKLALSSFSARFAEELAASPGRNFSNMLPARRGTGVNAGISSVTRVNWLKVSHALASTTNRSSSLWATHSPAILL
jgi:hypothetical protein